MGDFHSIHNEEVEYTQQQHVTARGGHNSCGFLVEVIAGKEVRLYGIQKTIDESAKYFKHPRLTPSQDRLCRSHPPHNRPLCRRFAEPRHRLDPLRPPRRSLAHWLRVLHHRLLPQEARALCPQCRYVGTSRRHSPGGCCAVLV